MYNCRKTDDRALDDEERELVAATFHPAVQELSDAELGKLVGLLRARRDRAQSLARQRRREMRGKAPPRGGEASREDAGSKLKAEVLGGAMRRLNSEVARRKTMKARVALIANQQRALELAEAAKQGHETFNSRTAHDGMRAKPNRRGGRIGSAMEAGRVSQFVKTAQAKRDSH
ncbi:MAG: hypothetical protein Kilf2KO_24800 [Rhodospirillales bacterium]